MSAAKHTPAPWKLDDDEVHPVVWKGSENAKNLALIARVSNWSGEGRELREQAAANARLIAAAPELLAALKTFVAEYVQLVASGDAGNWDAEDEDKVKAARAAIAKAEVQS